jgi:hypothetical protein
VEPTAGFAQLQLGFVDQTQRRYEVIRQLVPFADCTATQQAQETHTHPDTVRKLHRRFRQRDMLGLLPDNIEWWSGGGRPGFWKPFGRRVIHSNPSMKRSTIGNWPGSCLSK